MLNEHTHAHTLKHKHEEIMHVYSHTFLFFRHESDDADFTLRTTHGFAVLASSGGCSFGDMYSTLGSCDQLDPTEVHREGPVAMVTAIQRA